MQLSGYRTISDQLNETWRYREFEEMLPEEIFIFGSMWGAIQLVEKKFERERQKDSIAALAAKYKDSAWLFKAIASTPGIKHKELAKKGNQSPSQLSQFMTSVCQDGLIAFHRMGREKYYFLQRDGELVYEIIQNINKINKE